MLHWRIGRQNSAAMPAHISNVRVQIVIIMFGRAKNVWEGQKSVGGLLSKNCIQFGFALIFCCCVTIS